MYGCEQENATLDFKWDIYLFILFIQNLYSALLTNKRALMRYSIIKSITKSYYSESKNMYGCEQENATLDFKWDIYLFILFIQNLYSALLTNKRALMRYSIIKSITKSYYSESKNMYGCEQENATLDFKWDIYLFILFIQNLYSALLTNKRALMRYSIIKSITKSYYSESKNIYE